MHSPIIDPQTSGLHFPPPLVELHSRPWPELLIAAAQIAVIEAMFEKEVFGKRHPGGLVLAFHSRRTKQRIVRAREFDMQEEGLLKFGPRAYEVDRGVGELVVDVGRQAEGLVAVDPPIVGLKGP